MNANLSIASLRSLLALSEKRDVLLIEIQKIETEMSKIAGSGTRAGRSKMQNLLVKALPKPSKRRAKRGTVKKLILAGLKDAGEAGIAVKHLAAKHGLKPASVHVWLGTTGKKSGLIEALGKGIYRLKESFGVEPVQNSIKAPKPKATGKVQKAPQKGKIRKKS